MTDSGPRRASRLPPERRAAILTATVDLLVQHGYEATSMEAVAAASGTSKATLYRHWTDKPTLVLAGVTEGSGVDLGAIDTGDTRSDLELLRRQLLARLERNVQVVLALSLAARTDPALRSAQQGWVDRKLSHLAAIGQRAVERGELEAEVLPHLPHLLIGVIFTPFLLESDRNGSRMEAVSTAFDSLLLPVFDLTERE